MFRTLLATTALAALMTAPTLAQEAQTTTDPNAAAGANVTVETTGEPEVIVETPAAGETTTQPAETTTTQPAETTTTQPAETTTTQPADTMQAQPAQGLSLEQGYQPQPTDQLATNLIGMTVYSTLQDPNAAAAAAPADPAATGATAPVDAAGQAAGQAVDAAGQAVTDAGQAAAGAVDPTAGREAIGDISDFVLDNSGQVKAVIIGVGGFLGIGEKAVAVDFAQLRWVADPNGEQVLMMDTTREALEAAPEFASDQIGQAVNADAAAVEGQQSTGATTTVTTTEPAEQPAEEPAAPAAQ